MPPDRWARIKELLSQVLPLPPGERQRFLDLACGEDAALREDIERFLRALPVRASRHTAVYRLRKFLSRRRWEVAAVGLIWRQGRIAQARFEQLHRLTNSIVFELYDAIQDLPGSIAARKLLVERALEHLRSLEAAARDNRDLQWDVASAYKRIGDVQGESGRPNLGDAPGAIQSYGKAREFLAGLRRREPGNVRVLELLSGVNGALADLYGDRGDLTKSVALRREAAEALLEIARRDPGIRARRAAVMARWNLAEAVTQAGDLPAAAEAWRSVLAAYLEIAALEPASAGARRNVALGHKRLGAVLAKLNDPRALEHYGEALKIDSARLAADPASGEAAMDLSFDYSDIAWVHMTAPPSPSPVRCSD